MTQPRADYVVPGQCLGINPDALRAFDDPLYCAPTWRDIAAVKEHYQLSGLAIAKIIGTRDRNVRKYISDPSTVAKDCHAKMSYAQWRLLLITKKIVTPSEI